MVRCLVRWEGGPSGPGLSFGLGEESDDVHAHPWQAPRRNPRAVGYWRSGVEAHGNQLNSTPRALKTSRDLIGVRAVPDGEETLPHAVQVRKPGPASAGAICGVARTGYGTRSSGSC